MDRFEIARALSIAPADVQEFEDTDYGVAVDVRDGGCRLIDRDGGVWALDDHPANRSRRRWEPPAAVAEEDEAPPGDGAGGEVPDGTADDVLGWVGDDPGRAAQALAVEEGRDHPRSTLVAKLRKAVG